MAYRPPNFRKPARQNRYERYNPFIHNESANRKFEKTLAECSQIKQNGVYPIKILKRTEKPQKSNVNLTADTADDCKLSSPNDSENDCDWDSNELSTNGNTNSVKTTNSMNVIKPVILQKAMENIEKVPIIHKQQQKQRKVPIIHSNGGKKPLLNTFYSGMSGIKIDLSSAKNTHSAWFAVSESTQPQSVSIPNSPHHSLHSQPLSSNGSMHNIMTQGPLQMNDGSSFCQNNFVKNEHLHSKERKEEEVIYRWDLDAPSTLNEYHWLCYHFKSGDVRSCKAGSSCLWRHYDFGLRGDIVTAWNIGAAEEYEATFKELEIAKELKERMEAKYEWLREIKADDDDDDDRWILTKHDYKIMVALLSTFEQRKDDKMDYYTMGKLAIDHLRSLCRN